MTYNTKERIFNSLSIKLQLSFRLPFIPCELCQVGSRLTHGLSVLPGPKVKAEIGAFVLWDVSLRWDPCSEDVSLWSSSLAFVGKENKSSTPSPLKM